MKGELGWRIANGVFVVLWIVSAEKGEGSSAKIAVDILGSVFSRHLRQEGHRLFDEVLVEGSQQPVVALYVRDMVLHKHGGHGIVFGGEIK